MLPAKIDPETAARVRACIIRCQRNGADVVRALDELGLLWHPAKALQAGQEFMAARLSAAEEATLKSLAHPAPVPANALDAKRLVIAWLRKAAGATLKER